MPSHKPKFGPAEIIILIMAGLLCLVVATGNSRRVIEWLFTPAAVLIVVVMLFEYLVLKGADRSEIYKRELAQARQKRREDVLALREMEPRLIEARERIDSALSQVPAAGGAMSEEARRALEAANGAIQSAHEKLREQI